MSAHNKISAIFQVRMGSTRLPGKALLDIAGKSLLQHVVERVKKSKCIDEIILATTAKAEDLPIIEFAENHALVYFAGSEYDVLNRFYMAAKSAAANTIVRITPDDPFKDPEIIDRVIDIYLTEKLDFAYNNNPPSFPEGLDAEVFSFEALEKAEKESQDPFEREHVTQYLYRHPERFKQKNLLYTEDISFLRWTIDTQADFEMAKLVYEHLYRQGEVFLMNDILDLLKDRPEIAKINSQVNRSYMFRRKTQKIS